MKIVSWNCNGAFRKKFDALEDYDTDLLVIQECEDPARSTSRYSDWAGNYHWRGKSKNKGIGVFARKGASLKILDWPDNDLQQFLPCRINDTFNLLAVWTKQANSPTFQYIGQLWKYLQLNKARMTGIDTVICGDFNSNMIWDKWDRWWNHSDIVRELEEIHIHSMYHEHSQEKQGEETAATLFMHRKIEKPYHIDYAFTSRHLLDEGSIDIGKPGTWLVHSDHMPLIFSLPSCYPLNR